MLDNTIAVVLFLSNAFFVVKMIFIAWISQVWLHLKHVLTVIVDEYMCLRLVELRSDIWLLSVKFTSNHYVYNVIEYLFSLFNSHSVDSQKSHSVMKNMFLSYECIMYNAIQIILFCSLNHDEKVVCVS